MENTQLKEEIKKLFDKREELHKQYKEIDTQIEKKMFNFASSIYIGKYIKSDIGIDKVYKINKIDDVKIAYEYKDMYIVYMSATEYSIKNFNKWDVQYRFFIDINGQMADNHLTIVNDIKEITEIDKCCEIMKDKDGKLLGIHKHVAFIDKRGNITGGVIKKFEVEKGTVDVVTVVNGKNKHYHIEPNKLKGI